MIEGSELREPPAVASTLGKYVIRAAVGSGSSGTVYDAWDPDLLRRVAVKQVQLTGRTEAEQQELRARLRQEAQYAGRLTDPGVVSVYDYGEQDGLAYLVMEFVDGGTLGALLRAQQARMSPAHAAGIVQEMLAALGACHEAGVLHRDIKPNNVMMSRTGTVKLTDFGISRTEVSDLTAPGTLIGTPTYMSPEQFDTRAPLDARSDLYQCGVVLYELLTGRKPFEGDLFAVMHQVRTELPEPPSKIAPEVPPALDAVVLRAMAKLPADRFPDAGSFADALQRSLVAETPQPRAARRLLPVLLGLVLGLLAIGGGAWFVLWQRPASVHSTMAPVVAEVAPAENSPPPVQAAAVQPPAIRSLDAAARLLPRLANLPCAAIEATVVQDPPSIRLDGIVGDATAAGDLAALLADYPGPVSRTALTVFPATDTSCRIADLVRAAPPGALRLALAGGRSRLADGDTIRMNLAMPDFAGDVRLDYITDGGRTVVHLDPGPAGKRHWDADAQVLLGPEGDGVIGTVGAPYGTDLVLITVSERPLLPDTAANEGAAEPYLEALQAAVAFATQRGLRVASAAVVLETAAR
jgi:serine/threonine-protein kinase